MSSTDGRSSEHLQIIDSRTAGTPTKGVLGEGQVRGRPPRNKSQIHQGVAPLSPFGGSSQKFQQLPEPIDKPPYHYQLSTALPDIEKEAGDLGKISFHMVGDTGGIKSPEYQTHVATAMAEDLNGLDADKPVFCYHLGDVVYYNGQIRNYYSQFYEAYEHYGAPILAIPGNHDGDPIDNSQSSLDGWARFFMSAQTRVNPESQDAPRTTMSLPNPYFTLVAPFVTIVGLYTNVPEGGSVDSVQQQWLTNELANAPKDKALIVTLHHPIYSFDDHHSGSPRMADVLQHAINDSRRVPNLVASGHVHNYQRIERSLVAGHETPFLVSGDGGYFNLHHMNIDPPKDTTIEAPLKKGSHGKHEPVVHDTDTGAKLIYSNHTNHGYCTITVDKDSISGAASFVDEARYPGMRAADTFSYSAKAVFLPDKVIVSL